MKRKWFSLFLCIMMLLSMLGFAGCVIGGEESSAKESAIMASVQPTEDENVVAIFVEKTEADVTLFAVMKHLKNKEQLTFVADGTGMITEINGKKNPADWSYCWMLYTSDASLSNTEYGTYNLNGKTLGSALFGANALRVKAGESYVWYYQKF